MPSLRVGLHLAVTRARPVLPAAEIADLVDASGRLRSNLAEAGLRFFFVPRVRRQLEAEIRAQFLAFRATGLRLDHVNAHNHMHLHPTVLGALLRAAREFGAPPVRLPSEPFLPSWRAAGDRMGKRLLSSLLLLPWAGLARARLRRAGVPCNDHLFGIFDAGRMRADFVQRLLAHLPPGVSELHFHPAKARWSELDPLAPGFDAEDELLALTSPAVAAAVDRLGIRRVGFRDLAGGNR
jgi:hopanoid biosynthesis associated protein HpnK